MSRPCFAAVLAALIAVPVFAAILPPPASAQTGPVVEVPRPMPGASPAPIQITPSQPAPGSLRSDNGAPVYRVPESGGSAETGNYRAPTTVIPPGSTIIVR